MAWNDGISKEMNDFIINQIAKIPQCAEEAVKETVDKYAQQFYVNVRNSTPRRKSYYNNVNTELDTSLVKEKNTKRGKNYYGYTVYFKGEFKNGNSSVPYEKLANILNYGSHTRQRKKDGSYGDTYENVVATRFISKQIKKLKNMSEEINDKFIAKEKEVMK